MKVCCSSSSRFFVFSRTQTTDWERGAPRKATFASTTSRSKPSRRHVTHLQLLRARFAVAPRANMAEVSSGTHRRDANMKGDETTIKARDRNVAGNRTTRVARCGKSHSILFYGSSISLAIEYGTCWQYTVHLDDLVQIELPKKTGCVTTADESEWRSSAVEQSKRSWFALVGSTPLTQRAKSETATHWQLIKTQTKKKRATEWLGKAEKQNSVTRNEKK